MFVQNLFLDCFRTIKWNAGYLFEQSTQEPSFLGKVVTADESWVFVYDPETNIYSSKWHPSLSPRPKKSRATKSNIKEMLVAFFDDDREFVPTGTGVTAAFYVDVLMRLRESVRRKTHQKWKNDWTLHHDNAPSHMAMAVGQFLAKNNIPIVPHPPYSPDVAPRNLWLFPALKMGLRKRRFATVEDMKENADARLRAIKK
jgi:histone-lysine N-methyltransferase SETMAR